VRREHRGEDRDEQDDDDTGDRSDGRPANQWRTRGSSTA